MQDVRQMNPLARFNAAVAIRQLPDISGWPPLAGWNDRPCAKHAAQGVQAWCLQCGVILRRHQRVGAAWLYFSGRGLLGDDVGTGKTPQVAALLAMCRATGELGLHARTVIVCQPSAILQWRDQLLRMIPDLRIIALADLTPGKRRDAYVSPWEVVIIGPQTLAPARGKAVSRGGDVEYLENFPIGCLVYDDVDAMRDRSNRTAYAIRKLAERSPRVIAAHATSVQKRLLELYSFLEPVGGTQVFGTQRQFQFRFVQRDRVFYTAKDPAGRNVIKTREKDIGVKNIDELRWLLAPMFLRRRAQDITDVSLPEIITNTVYLEATSGQRARYEELRAGVLRKIREEGEAVSRPAAVALFTHGNQICSGLATLDGGRDDSAKLDWAEDMIDHLDPDEKVVAFVYFTPNVQALSARLAAAGTGHVVMWGREHKAAEREERLRRFREDPACRVLIGTTTIERSLNLQAARHVIAVDTILNPMRMLQIVGRVRRDGSAYRSIYFHQLFLRNTQEDAYLSQLQQEQATVDAVWGEHGELFQETAAPIDLMNMIVGNSRRRAA